MSTSSDSIGRAAISNLSARITYLAAAFATMFVGLWVHRGGLALGPAPRDVAGDALWATMITFGISALFPTRSLLSRAAIAYAICAAVEFSQLIHTPSLDALRATTLGGLVLGSGFDFRDLAAYAAGVALGVALEWAVRRLSGHEPLH